MHFRCLLTSASRGFLIPAFCIVTLVIAAERPTNSLFINKYATSDVVYANGETAHFNSKNFGMVNKGDFVTVRLAMPEEPLLVDPTLCFYIYHSVTNIYVSPANVKISGGGGVRAPLFSYGEDIAARGDMVGGYHFMVRLPDDIWGNEIVITFRVTEDQAFSRIKNLRLYSAQNAYQYIFDMNPIGLMVAIPMAFFGFFALIVFLINGRFDISGRKGAYIALFALCLSAWMLSSKSAQLLFGLNQYFWTLIEFIAVFVMAIPLLLYAYETEPCGSLFRRIIGYSVAINFAFFAVSSVLHFTNTVHYCRLLLPAQGLVFISGLLLLAFAIRRRAKGGHADKIFFAGMLILFATGLYELVRQPALRFIPVIWTDFNLPSVLPLGSLFFILYLLRAYNAENTERQKALITAQVIASDLRKLVEHTPAGICVLAPDEPMTIREANDIFYRMFGCTKDDFQTLLSPLSEQNRNALREIRENMLAGRAPLSEVELTIVNKQNEKREVLVKLLCDHSDGDQITLSALDITDRKRMEEEMRLLEREYQIALRMSKRQVLTYDIAGKRASQLPGIVNLLHLGDRIENFPEMMIENELIDEDSVPTFRNFFQAIWRGDLHGNSYIRMRGVGETEYHWFKAEFENILNDGKPARAILSAYDATEQRERELAYSRLQQSINEIPFEEYKAYERNLTRDIVEAASGGAFVSAINIPSSDATRSIQRAIQSYVYPDHAAALMEFTSRDRLIRAYRHGEQADSMEFLLRRSENTYLWFSLHVQLIEDSFSGDIKAYYLFRDIDHQKKQEIQKNLDLDNLRKELENSRIKVMINQMQPHFLYNALSAIQTIVKRDPDYASQLIYDFTIHLRSSIRALSSDAVIPFRDELRNIQAYLNIEQMRFGKRLKVKYEIDCDDFNIIPLSIQPLAENAARHGIFPKDEAGGTVTIRSYETEDFFVVEVEDDGVGFDVNMTIGREADSVGLKNLIFRLKSLMNAEIHVASKLGEGTRVTVKIPQQTHITMS